MAATRGDRWGREIGRLFKCEMTPAGRLCDNGRSKIECGVLSRTVERAEREAAAREILQAGATRTGTSIRIRNPVAPQTAQRVNPDKTSRTLVIRGTSERVLMVGNFNIRRLVESHVDCSGRIAPGKKIYQKRKKKSVK